MRGLHSMLTLTPAGLVLAAGLSTIRLRPRRPRSSTGGPRAANWRPSRCSPTSSPRPAAPGSTTRSPAAQNARTAGINRIVGGDPPTAMQFNTGLQFDEVVGNGFLRDLEEVAAAGKWRDVLPEAIIKATNREGKFYAVPVNIHGQSWLWYNTEVLAEAGVEPPSDLRRRCSRSGRSSRTRAWSRWRSAASRTGSGSCSTR